MLKHSEHETWATDLQLLLQFVLLAQPAVHARLSEAFLRAAAGSFDFSTFSFPSCVCSPTGCCAPLPFNGHLLPFPALK